MASRCFVPDEWLLSDLRGDNGLGHQEETAEFLKRLREKCDHIAVVRPSPWMRKAYSLMTELRPPVRSLSKYLHSAILKDSLKCQMLDAESISSIVPADVKVLVPNSDLYIAEIFFAASAEVIVTTDGDFHEVQDRSGGRISIRMRDEFLAEYLR